MKLQTRCPHCHQIEPISAGLDSQASHSCPSCGLSYVPHRHLFVADRVSEVSVAVRDDPVPPPPKGRLVPRPMSASELATALAKAAEQARRVRMRWLLGCLVLTVLLITQIGLHHRHLWSARYPVLELVFNTLCQALRCRVQAPEMLDAISVLSSGFDQHENGSFLLSLHVRNALDHPVATPTIELTLTDAQDRAVLRKVLLPESVGLPAALPPGDGMQTESRFELDAELHAPVSGFRVELFYP